MNRLKTHSKTSFYFNPIFIGLFLIITISGYFLFKTFSAENKLQQLEKKLALEKAKNKEIDIETVSPEQVYQWLRKPTIQLIDIRSAKEYSIKHIESSINIPLDQLRENLTKFSPDKKIVIIDRENSAKGKILVDHFKKQNLNILYLEGGILKYAQENYPLITSGDLNNPVNQIKVTTLSAQEIKDKLLKGKIFSFVDTRPEYLYLTDKIDGSFNIPLEKIESRKDTLPVHTILLFDIDTLRSWKAGVKLYDMGITNFYVCSDPYNTLKSILFSKDKSTK